MVCLCRHRVTSIMIGIVLVNVSFTVLERTLPVSFTIESFIFPIKYSRIGCHCVWFLAWVIRRRMTGKRGQPRLVNQSDRRLQGSIREIHWNLQASLDPLRRTGKWICSLDPYFLLPHVKEHKQIGTCVGLGVDESKGILHVCTYNIQFPLAEPKHCQKSGIAAVSSTFARES